MSANATASPKKRPLSYSANKKNHANRLRHKELTKYQTDQIRSAERSTKKQLLNIHLALFGHMFIQLHTLSH